MAHSLQEALENLEKNHFPPSKVTAFIYQLLKAAGHGTPSGPPGGGGGEC